MIELNRLISYVINEATFSKIYRNMENKTCGILTAYRSDLSHKENIKRNQQLAEDLRANGLGFNRVIGRYKEADSDKIATESSFIVYTEKDKYWLKNILIKLGIKYNQDSIIVIDKQNGAYLIGASGNDKNLPKNSELFIGKFTPSKIADVYTQLGKDSFIFESKEIESCSDGYLNELFKEDKIEQNDSYDILVEKLTKRYNRLCKNNSDFVIDTLFK